MQGWNSIRTAKSEKVPEILALNELL